MGRHTQKKLAEQEGKYYENRQKYMQSLERKCLPGEKLMTCPHCQQTGVYPGWQQMVTHVEVKYRGCRLKNQTHPGEIIK